MKSVDSGLDATGSGSRTRKRNKKQMRPVSGAKSTAAE